MRLIALTTAAIMSAIIFASGSQAAHAAPQPENHQTQAPQPAQQIVTVASGDNLSNIATTNNSTMERVFDANSEVTNPNLIHPDQKLRIPNATEELAVRPMPVAVVAAPVPQAPSAAPVAQSSKRSAPSQATPVAGGSVWDQIAACESGGNWSTNTGNGFYGGLQFTVSSWQGTGGTGLPSQASREEQIARAQTLQARQGWGAWPACTAKLGLH